MKRKSVFPLVLALLAAFMLTSCDARSEAARVLGIDISGGEEVSSYDTHGGLQGDGTSCIAYRFDSDAVLDEIKSSAEWTGFPLDDTVQALVSMINNSADHPVIPEIESGYYLLIDRQDGTEGDILHRYSFNFTLGLYDTDTNTLYFCELDT